MRVEAVGKLRQRQWKPGTQSFANLIFVLSSRSGHVKPWLNLEGPPPKAKYILRSIENKYREGKVKRTQEWEWNRTWNWVRTRSRRMIVRWRRAFCRTIQRVIGCCKPKSSDGGTAKASLNRANLVAVNRPETGWPNHEQAEAEVKLRGGPNRSELQNARMTCG